jgi:hypothetical protein
MARPHAAAASARAATARAPDRVHEEPARHRRAVDARERGRERSDRARVGLDGGAEHDARAARAAAREHARARGADGEDERVVERKRFDAERAARVSDACRVRRAVCDAQASSSAPSSTWRVSPSSATTRGARGEGGAHAAGANVASAAELSIATSSRAPSSAPSRADRAR